MADGLKSVRACALGKGCSSEAGKSETEMGQKCKHCGLIPDLLLLAAAIGPCWNQE